MAVKDWSTTAASNTSIGGISIAEGIPPANVNNAMREMMAQLAKYLQPLVNVLDYGATGDGSTDDTTAIAAAITAAGANGIVYFPDPATAYEVTGNLAPLSGQTWVGSGYGARLLLEASSGANPIVLMNAKDNVRLTGLRFDCSGCADATLYAAQCTDACDNIQIDNCYSTGGMIRITATATACTDIRILDNYLLNVAVGGTGAGAIEINSDTNRFVVRGNTVYNSTGAGIGIFTASSNGIIEGNLCEANTGCGIYMDRGDHITIANNICRANDQSGIGINAGVSGQHSTFWSVVGNVCESNLFDGIDCSLDVLGGTQRAAWGTIANNILRLNGDAVAVQGTGIYVVDAADIVISGNIIQGNVLHGLAVSNATNLNITNNHCSLNGTKAANTYDGINLLTTTYSVISNNNCTNEGGGAVQKYGINESTACNYNIITGNMLYNNATGGSVITGANTVNQHNYP